MVTVVWWQ